MNIGEIVNVVNKPKPNAAFCGLILTGIWECIKPNFDNEQKTHKGGAIMEALRVDIVLSPENQKKLEEFKNYWKDVVAEAQNDADYDSENAKNRVVKNLTKKSITKSDELEHFLLKQQNYQRILDFMRYDKIDSWNERKMIKCSDGWIMYDPRNWDINDDSGMCVELAIKACSYLKLMYPDDYFFVAQDKKRPCGWNHYFVATTSTFENDLIDYIVDPSENRQGYLGETGDWDGSGKEYVLLKEDISNVGTATVSPTVEIMKYTDNLLPLISPRHLDSDNLGAFDFSVNAEADKPLSLSIKKNGSDENLELSNKIKSQEIIDFGKENDLNIPQDLADKLVEMAVKMSQNTIKTNLTMEEFEAQNPKLTELESLDAEFEKLKII